MNKTVLSVLLFLFLIVGAACGPATKTSAPSIATQDTAAMASPTAAAAAVAPTATPLPSPTPMPEHTDAGDESTSGSSGSEATPAATPTEIVMTSGGRAVFRDHLAVADQVVGALASADPPGTGQVYQGWLISADGSPASVGFFELHQDGSAHLEWTSPDGHNLVASSTGFQVSLEPQGGSPAPTGKLVYAGKMNPEQSAHALALFVSNQGEPATPRNTAFGLGLLAQFDLANQHVQNAVNAAAIGALAEAKAHLEHVINILEGSQGERFKDYNGDGSAQNPGDGYGAIAYARQMAVLLNDSDLLTSETELENEMLTLEEQCVRIAALEDLGQVQQELAALKALFVNQRQATILAFYWAVQDALAIELQPTP